MKQDRREFLRKSLKIGALAGAVASSSAIANVSNEIKADGNGVVVGKSNKKEVLYHKTQMWEHFYKIAY